MLKLSVELQEPSHDAYKLAFYRSLAQSPEAIQSFCLVFTVLACLCPAEATELLGHVRSGLPHLARVSVGTEAPSQPVIPSELLRRSLADLPVDYKHIAGAGLPAVDSDGISPHAHVTGDESRSSCLPLSSPMNPDGWSYRLNYLADPQSLLFKQHPSENSEGIDCDINRNTASDISSSYAAIKTEPLELPQDPLSPSQPTPDADRILESVATPPEVYKSRALGPKCQENSPRPRENDRPNFAGIPVDSRGSKAFGLESAHRIYTGESLADAAVATIQHCGGKPVMENFSDVLPVYLSSWLSNEQEGRHPLGLPEIRLSSLQATCAEYFKALRAKTDTDTFEDNIRHRASQVLLFLCFEAFVRELQEKERSGTLVVKRANRSMSTIARDLIMEAIYPNEYKGSRKKFYRDALSNHTRYGSRWWRVGSCCGLGALLVCSDDIAYVVNRSAYRETAIDALINHVLNKQPGAVFLFECFAPLTQRLILGKGLKSYAEAIPLGALIKELTQIHVDGQFSEPPWRWIDPHSVADSAGPEFLWAQDSTRD
ncbi:hypothetical protein D8B26_007997 [Coccidioides posadasii str. Silveira]|uniref:Uncharacterized protein n=1 Tax=Coccidioides posadasii (strain RMSCC 757 / Silveira) TaxID=443226 RepID=E9DEB5_COCPS|nr:conserved hypothetical protein [Coccidioides posadasii str. Silveira]QVM13387.1 hypothetical protein D8B26_007997 [Coccidioides posadasii str. Silveira]